MIPAMSFATGYDVVPALGNPPSDFNFDLSSAVIRGEGEPWPAERDGDLRWRHSDLREVAYVYTHGLYDKIVEVGELQRTAP